MSIDRYGLVAHYQHYLTDGKLLDLSGKGNHGTINGATPTTDHNGRANRGWAFNGSSSVITITDATALHFSTKFTFEAIVKVNNLTSLQVFASKYNTSSKRSWLVGLTFNKLRFNISADGVNATIYESDELINTGIWYYYAYVFDGNIVKAYLNGNEITMTLTGGAPIVSLFDSNENTLLGFYNGGAAINYLNGNLSHCMITNRAKSASEIQKLYNYWRTH